MAMLVDAGAAGAEPAAAPGAGAVADAGGADEHRAAAAAAAARAAAAALVADGGEDDPRHDGQPQDDGAVDRLPAEPALRRAHELHRPTCAHLRRRAHLSLGSLFCGEVVR
uniref:Uncharacterized protein n=1 Tax=Oryza meridionalis TaxID=40149 RepID=A0A0E0ET99_9ORYZ